MRKGECRQNKIDDDSCYKLVILYKDINNSAHVLRARIGGKYLVQIALSEIYFMSIK